MCNENMDHADSELTCVDLFTGIGGIQLALKPLLRPLVYCDIDKNVRHVLSRLMSSGELPEAPIVNDVRNTDAICEIVANQDLDLMIATPSCKGFSVSNVSSPGLRHSETSLFSQVLTLVGMLHPRAVFLENVPGIVTANNGADLKSIVDEFERMGYNCKYGIFSAADVGAPHLRRRWYALCVRTPEITDRLRDMLTKYAGSMYMPDWQISAEPEQHMLDMPRAKEEYDVASARLGMCGNSVVPVCARHALSCLVQCDACGKRPPWPRRLTLDPDLAETPRRPSAKVLAIPERITRHQFPSPRYSIRRSCNRLIYRCTYDLPTFVRFWTEARGDRLGLLNPQFTEFVMGFPRDWTRYALDSTS